MNGDLRQQLRGVGGPGREQIAFHEEYAAANAPPGSTTSAKSCSALTLIAFGTPAQQARFPPKILAVEELWCQGGEQSAPVKRRVKRIVQERTDRRPDQTADPGLQLTSWAESEISERSTLINK